MVKTLDKTYVLDSCIGRRCYENAAYLDMLKVRWCNHSSKTIFTTVSIYEIDKRAEYRFVDVQSKIESVIGNKIKIEKFSNEIYQLGIWLRDNDNEKLLHIPDDRILAYAMLTDSILVTCDKKLERAARNVGQDVINPDKVIIDLTKTKSYLVTMARSKVSELKQKMNRPSQIIKKPVTKIVWRTFV